MPSNPYQKVSAYNQTQKAIQNEVPSTSREIDAHALLVCASRLNDAKSLMQSGDSKSRENLKVWSEAIRKNQRIWTYFQVAVTDPQNPLPNDIKAIIFNLSRYVDKQSFSAMGKFIPNIADSLININRTLAAGLSKAPPEATIRPISPQTNDVPTSLMTSA
ncbi:MAG: flagellar biosynthesis regulator FlaF [Alphaproteobacteria bacterium]|nr:flagellar biosynthesis regulator FlaF [Alphaproteobacteria bacterium]